MVTFTKTFSFKLSDEDNFEKALKILEKKHQPKNMSRLLSRLIREYVKENESPKKGKNLKYSPQISFNYKRDCPPFFSTDSTWREYLQHLQDRELHEFKEQLKEIMNASKSPRFSTNLNSKTLESDCPGFYQQLFTWAEFVSRISEDEYVIFKTKLLKILDQVSRHEDYLSRNSETITE
jgi:hypothetical protein